MQIDNLKEAQDLCDRLEATIPFTVRVGKQLLKTMLDGGNKASLDDVFTVDWVKYSGDVGGISCAFEYSDGKERYAVSLTHLKIDPEHPLADEVVAYQQRRIQRIKLQDLGGFGANLLANTNQPKRRKGGVGFGKK
jgi:hypothetical protein